MQGLVYPLIVFVLIQLIGPILSGLTEGKIAIPSSVTYTIAALALVWGLLVALGKVAAGRRKRARGPGPAIGHGQLTSVRKVLELTHAGVMWYVVRWHGPNEWADQPIPLDRVALHVQTPPRCPECLTELDQSQRFWGSWTWSCPACDFEVRARQDFELESMRAMKLAKREVERNAES